MIRSRIVACAVAVLATAGVAHSQTTAPSAARPVMPPVGNVQAYQSGANPIAQQLYQPIERPQPPLQTAMLPPAPQATVAAPQYAQPLIQQATHQAQPNQIQVQMESPYAASGHQAAPQKASPLGGLFGAFRRKPVTQVAYTPQTQFQPPTISQQPVAQQPMVQQQMAMQPPQAISCPPVQNFQVCEYVEEPETWIGMEALIWWSNSSDLPPLAIENPTGATVVGHPDSTVLFGGDVLDEDRPGFRIRAGRDFEGYGGMELEFFKLSSAYEDFLIATDGTPIVGRPFFNVLTGLEDTEIVGEPGVATGQVRASLESRLYGAAIHLYQVGVEENADPNDRFSARLKLGPRYLSLRENLFIEEFVSPFGVARLDRLRDNFDTDNNFLGGEIGIEVHRQRNNFFWRTNARIALGATHQELQVDGSTLRQVGGASAVLLPGGLLAQRTNSGRWQRNRFSVVPQSEFAIGWRSKGGWEISVGYNFMFWSRVLRASEQVDRNLNPNLLPPELAAFTGPASPSLGMKEDSYIAHGLSFGIEKSW